MHIAWHTATRSMSVLKLSVFMSVLLAATLLPMLSSPLPTHAVTDCSPNNIVYQGSSWLNGTGVNVCSTGDDSNNYINNINGVSTLSGWKWECVELVNRLYLTKGWITANWAGFGSTLVNNVPSGLTTEYQNHISYLNPGDVVTLTNGTGNGHAAIVNTVGGTSIQTVNQNTQSVLATSNISGSLSSGTGALGSWLPGYQIQAVIHAPNPPTVPWNFENLEGGSNPISPFSGNVGETPASVVFNGQLYTYYYDVTHGDLRVAYTAPQWLFDIVDGNGGTGKIDADVGQVPSAVVFNTVMYVFYYDNTNGNLRMAWSSNGTSWQTETLDGDPGSLSGYDANVGQTPFVTVYNNSLQLFYYQPDQGVLRHAWSSNGSSWNFETLDGNAGSVSGFSGNVGQDTSAAVYNSTLQLFYYDASQGDLRHAWADGSGWHFENLDGDAGSIGHLGANVGDNPTAFVYQGNLGVLYYDKTDGALRHAWSDTSGWHFETLAGGSSSILNDNSNIGTMSTAAIDSSGALQVFVYQAGGGNLVHIWNNGSWHEENLDGEGGQPAGRINANVGLDPDAIMFGTTLDVFYYDADNGALRHAWPQ